MEMFFKQDQQNFLHPEQCRKLFPAKKLSVLLFIFLAFFFHELAAQRLGPCFYIDRELRYERGDWQDYFKTFRKSGGVEGEQGLDFEYSVFNYGEKIYFFDLDTIADSEYPYTREGRRDKAGVKGTMNYSCCCRTLALKTKNFSRQIGEKVPFTNGVTYTFFAESKKGIWLMRDEYKQCFYYSPPPRPAELHHRKPRLAPVKEDLINYR
jgi:hypothetical protein